MDDRSRVALFMGLGALVGGLAGYLLVTERGRSVRQGLGPRLQAFIDEAEELAQAFDRTRRAVADGWKTFNQIVDDRQADVREWHRS
jgi:gas vesicle protein